MHACMNALFPRMRVSVCIYECMHVHTCAAAYFWSSLVYISIMRLIRMHATDISQGVSRVFLYCRGGPSFLPRSWQPPLFRGFFPSRRAAAAAAPVEGYMQIACMQTSGPQLEQLHAGDPIVCVSAATAAMHIFIYLVILLASPWDTRV